MSIIIHDFEVSPRQDSPGSSTQPKKAAASDKKAALSLIELCRVQRHAHQRCLRLWAH